MLDIGLPLRKRFGLLRVNIQPQNMEPFFDEAEEQREAHIAQPHDPYDGLLPVNLVNEC